MVRTKVFVGNLSFNTQEPELAAQFGTAGKVIKANIITRGPRSLGYGFVEMDSEEDAQSAVNLMNKKEIDGRQINVEIAKPQEENPEKQPRQPKEEGELKRKPRKRAAYRKREPEGEGGQKPETEETEREGEGDKPRKPRAKRPPRVRSDSGSQPPRVPNEKKEESKTTLFVANLPFSLDDDGFGKIITDLGLKLKSAHVVKKRNGRSKGYGFVEFDTEEDQQKSLQAINKKVVDNRELSVKVALTEVKGEENGKSEETKPAERKVVPAEKSTKPAEKKAAAPAEKKVVAPAEKKAAAPAPAEKKAVAPAEKKAVPAEKKTAPVVQAKSPEKEEAKK